MADRSLAFFTTLANKTTSVDPTTGLNTNQHTVQYDIKKYDQTDPLKPGTSESKTVNYNLVQSLQAEGQFINYQGNSATNNFTPTTAYPELDSDIKLSSIIEWTKKNHPSMVVSYANFTYLKDFGVYPANRLMILRRFTDGVPHDLFNCTTIPLNTMCTYYSLEKSPFTFTCNEEWTPFSSSIMTLLQDVVGIKFDSIPVIGGIINAATTAAPSNLQQTVIEAIGQKLGLTSSGDALYGDPNIIYEAAIRKADSEGISSGLSSSITLNFETTYIFREINGVDAKAEMLDIIANAIHMGTSNARFILTHNANDKLNKIMTAMSSGDITDLLKTILEAISDTFNKSAKLLKNVADTAIKDGAEALKGNSKPLIDDILSTANYIIKNRFSRYKWQLRGAVGALTGQHTAPWHITIGNPKCPWFTIGNLVISSVNLDFGGELSYVDIPTEVTVKIQLKSGRNMGAEELTSLFNNGKGRIYDTPEKIQILKVPNNQLSTFNDTPQSNNGNQDQNISNAPVDTNTKNNITNTSNFMLNNTNGSDNNLIP